MTRELKPSGEAATRPAGSDVMRDLVEADPVVVLEIAAAIAESGRVPPDRVAELAAEHVARLEHADKTRLRTTIEQMLLGVHVDDALEWLHLTGALRLLFPELEATVDL